MAYPWIRAEIHGHYPSVIHGSVQKTMDPIHGMSKDIIHGSMQNKCYFASEADMMDPIRDLSMDWYTKSQTLSITYPWISLLPWILSMSTHNKCHIFSSISKY